MKINRNTLKDLRLHLDGILLFSMTILSATFFLKDHPEIGSTSTIKLIIYSLLTSISQIAIFYQLGEYKSFWRFSSYYTCSNFGKIFLASSVPVVFLSLEFFASGSFKLSLLNALTSFFVLVSARFARRFFYDANLKKRSSFTENVLIYGAGRGGWDLVKYFKSKTNSGISIVGFIDDDKTKHGNVVGGIRVYGGFNDLETIIEKTMAKRIVISTRSIPSEKLKNTLERSFVHKVKVQLKESEFKSKEHSFPLVRDLNLNDLVGKANKPVDLQNLREDLEGKTVLVTGAGGSIGSELCRQLLSLNPKELVILDHSEFNLFSIYMELNKLESKTKVTPVMKDIAKMEQVEEVFKLHNPEFVYHAAAYKHVHLVELNPNSAIINNVKGTKNLLECAEKYDINRFLLISTDKAVNPCNVMGRTKRVCELMTTSAAIRLDKRFSSVRFGNVLGSSGSLVPILYEQIKNGGPITITDKRMKRYFMTIPEAVKLVLRASCSSKPGDINILKMGDMIPIVDVAKNLLLTMGKTEEEVPIVYTGAKPGEKLYEELYLNGNELRTDHEDILTLPKGDSAVAFSEEFKKNINQLIFFADNNSDQKASEVLCDLTDVVGSNESKELENDKDHKVA